MDRRGMEQSRPRPPVTLLCGFLGAGKTTVLKHLLAQSGGRRWAAIVNDVAAINIDAQLVEGAPGAAVKDMVSLGNGCVCCSSRDELAEAVAELASAGDYEHILVETTGVAEPRALANLFVRKNPFGRTLGDFATLSALVTVIDASAFLREWASQRGVEGSRRTITGVKRPLLELMVEQVECSDLVLINKCDQVDEAAQVELESIIRSLNGRAEIIRTEQGQIPSELVVDRVRFDAKATLGAAEWIRTLNDLVPAEGGDAVRRPRAARHESRYGVGSFVYEARRPFVRARWEEVMARGLPGLLRAKGFFWLQEQPDEMGFLSLAGGVVRYDFVGYWWAAMVEGGKARLEDRPLRIRALWQEPHGERRQELVFIGVGMDESATRMALDGCLAPLGADAQAG